MELRRYGVETTFFFPLIDKGATDFEATPVTIAAGDCKIDKDGAGFNNVGTNFSHVAGGVYKVTLTATEMQARIITIKIVDQTATKEWEDQCIVVTTCNHASAEIPTISGDAPTAASVADAVWDEVVVDHQTNSTYGKSFANATTPKLAAIADGAVTAGVIAQDAIDADALKTDAVTEIQSGLATGADLTSVAGDVTAIRGVTDTLDPPTAAEIAAAVLSRDVGVNNDEDTATAQTLVAVILKLTSRFAAATGKTYKSDGVTTFMTQTPSTDPSADPITELAVGA